MAIIKRYPFTLLFVFLIFVLCLIPVPYVPVTHETFFDKWVHMAMYLSLGIVYWTEYYRCRSTLSGVPLLFAAVVGPVAMGGIIEVMQATLTTSRSGELLDFVADAVGVGLGAIVGRLVISRLFSWARRRAEGRR